MNKKIILRTLGTIAFLGMFVLLMNFAVKKQGPAKGYRIKIKEVVYETNTYIIDEDYVVFQDEYGRDVEVHKNFVSREEIR